MTGMGGSGSATGNALITDAFSTSTLHQFLVVLSILLLGSLAWMLLGPRFAGAAPLPVEPRGRRILRIGVALLWILDAYLQTQSSMPLGLPDGVLTPSAETSPHWVQHLVANGVSIWQRQPVHVAVAVIWIQLGIGLWLLAARSGWMGKLGALASIAWALSIWTVGTGFGGIFAPGASLLFGWPGSSLFYAVISGLLLLPPRWWSSERSTRRGVRILGAFFGAMALLQAWPGRGTWAGVDAHHQPVGQLTAMAHAMAETPQPSAIHTLVAHFATLTGDLPVLVNGVAVVAMAAIAVALVRATPRSLRFGVVVGFVFCATTWVFVEDLGFFGGVGTDPNSMPPVALLLAGLVVAVTHRLAEEPTSATARSAGGLVAMTLGGAAAIVTLLGAIPFAAATVSNSVDPLLAEAINTPPQGVHFAALPFTLVDQRGRRTTMASFEGRAVALTFLDPVCVNDCPSIAREMAATDVLLGDRAKDVALVAIVANPTYRSTSSTALFTAENGLAHHANWYFLTGSLPELERLWAFYDVQTSNLPGGAMAMHNDVTYLVDPHGEARLVFASTPGDTNLLHASYSAFLADRLEALA